MSWEYPWMGMWLVAWMGGMVLSWRRYQQLRRDIAEWTALGIEWTQSLDAHRWGRSMVIWGVVSLCMIISGMGPRWSMVSQTRTTTTPEGLAIVLDTSLSMAAQDVIPSRWGVAMAWAQAEAARCSDCWVGLGTFEGIWDPIVPLTRDRPFLLKSLAGLQPEQLPIPGTELANAVEVGISLLAHYPGPKRMLILSDGETHGTAYRDAIKDAVSQGIRVDTIGVGTPDPTPMPTPNGPDHWKRTKRQELAFSRFHSEPLRDMAHQTGGRYQHPGTPPPSLVSPIPTRDTLPLSPSPPPSPPQGPSFDWVLGLGMMGLMIGLRWK